MMICAYAEEYLNDALKNLGEAFDYAVNGCGVKLDKFTQLFIASGFADMFGNGVPKVIVGESGTELAMDIFQKVGKCINFPEYQIDYDNSKEYWFGYTLAYYQWYTGRTFKDILDNITINEIIRLYPTLHKESKDKIVDQINDIIQRKNRPTRLQQRRVQCALSQKALAKKSNINLLTLQEFEAREKNINNANGSTLLLLAKALNCKIEDLLECSTID